MTDVLFGQSYFLFFDPKLWRAMQPYPPLGTLYAAGYLRSQGYSVALFDSMLAESEAEWEMALRRVNPTFAVIYEDNFNYLSKMCLLRMRQAARTMIRMAREAGCTVILCGADATDHAADYLAFGADYVILGEGEITLAELLNSLSGRSPKSIQDILGLAFLDPEFHRNPPRPDIRDLDALPFPAWDLVDVARYRRVWLEKHGYFSMNMATTRGCPFHCNWCAKPIWGQRYHTRSPQNVVAELAWLKDNYAPDHISFVDDIFGLKPGWLPQYGELVAARQVRTPFKCLSRVDLLARPGEIDALQTAGAQIVWVGAESGSQKILDAMDKGTRVEQIYQAARSLQMAGIKVGFFLQFGYPGETRADIEKTIHMVRECDPDDIGFSVSYPMPGTKFFAAVQAQLGAKQNWHDSSDLAMLFAGPYPTGFYRQLHTVIHREFRARKAWQSLRRKFVPRQAVRWLYHFLSLPIARWRLFRLAVPANPHLSLPHLSYEQAAGPTPQDHP